MQLPRKRSTANNDAVDPQTSSTNASRSEEHRRAPALPASPLSVYSNEDEEVNPSSISDASAAAPSSSFLVDDDQNSDSSDFSQLSQKGHEPSQSASSSASLGGAKRVAPEPLPRKRRKRRLTFDNNFGQQHSSRVDTQMVLSCSSSFSAASVSDTPSGASYITSMTPAELQIDSLPSEWAQQIRRLQEIRSKAKDPKLLLDLPPVTANELEWVVERFSQKEFVALHKIWSPPKIFEQTVFRLLLFPAGNRNRSESPSCYLAIDPVASLPEEFRPFWRMQRAPFTITACNWQNWKKAHTYRPDTFAFSFESSDRGWEELVTRDRSYNNPLDLMLGPRGQLLLRGQLCLKPVECVIPSPRVSTLRPLVAPASVPKLLYAGLRNHGATCYLNALMQMLFHVGAFRLAVFEMTRDQDKQAVEQIDASEGKNTDSVTNESGTMTVEAMAAQLNEEEAERILREQPPSWGGGMQKVNESGVAESLSLVAALQNVFLDLCRGGAEPTATLELLSSFGWGADESLTQHDAQELNRLLSDRLEARMKGGPSDGSLRRLFAGEFENFIECVDVEFASVRKEEFYDLQLDVQGCDSLEMSLRQYVSAEMLEGENAYAAEGHGKQRAQKGVRFLSFPPVVQFHLKRFTFDPNYMSMVKVNERFTYPERLDLEEFVKGSGTYVLFGVIVHAGDVSGGHYYAFARPDGGKHWWKFDDECVAPVSPYSALADCYGGTEPRCHSLDKTPQGQAVSRLHSAYILFYVREDMEEELLRVPEVKDVNPYLERRRMLERRHDQRREAATEWLRNHIQVRYVTEDTLFGLKCAGSSEGRPTELPFAFCETLLATMPMPELLQRVRQMALSGRFGQSVQRDATKVGLWFFDAPTNYGGVRVMAVDLCQTTTANKSGKYYTLYDHLTWATEGSRKAPDSRRVLVLLVRRMMEPPRALYSGPKQDDIVMQFQRIATVKLFVPTVSATPPKMLGFVDLNIERLDECFEQFLRRVWRVREEGDDGIIETAFPEAKELSVDDLIAVIPDGIFTEHEMVDSVGKRLRDYLASQQYGHLNPEWPSPVLVLAAAPSLAVIAAADEARSLAAQLAKESATSNNVPLCNDVQHRTSKELHLHPLLEQKVDEFLHSFSLNDVDPEAKAVMSLEPRQQKAAIARLLQQGFDDEQFPPHVVPSRLKPPTMPKSIPLTLPEWCHSREAVCRLTVKFYNPFEALARWETSACQPLPLEVGAGGGDCNKAADESTPVDGKAEIALERCAPLHSVELSVNLHWPTEIALQKLAWEVGVEPYFTALSIDPPLSNRPTPILASPIGKRFLDFTASVMFPLSESAAGIKNILNLYGEHKHGPDKLESLHRTIGRAQGCTSKDAVVFHFYALPRIRLHSHFGFRVLNAKADSVGFLHLKIPDIEKVTVTWVITELLKSLTPAMMERGLSSVTSWRLACSGATPRQPPDAGIQHPVRPVSLNLIENDDGLRLTLRDLGKWQLDSPLRLEPDFSPEEKRELQSGNSVVVTVLHRNKDKEYFGHPFLFVAKKSATVQELKEAVRQKLELTSCQLVRSKFLIVLDCRPAFVKEHEQPFARVGCTQGVMVAIGKNPYAGDDSYFRSQQLVIRE